MHYCIHFWCGFRCSEMVRRSVKTMHFNHVDISGRFFSTANHKIATQKMTTGACTTCFEQSSSIRIRLAQRAASFTASLIITLPLKLGAHAQCSYFGRTKYGVLKQIEKCQKLLMADEMLMTHSLCRMSLKRMASVTGKNKFHSYVF